MLVKLKQDFIGSSAGKVMDVPTLRLLPRMVRVFSDNMLRHDNPDHRRLRRLVEQAFNRHSVENMRGRIGVLCHGLLDSDFCGSSRRR